MSTQTLKRKFFRGLRWNLLGSIIYEASKMGHQIALLSVLGLTTYGLVGSTFSFMYLTLHVADFESGPSILPFHKEIFSSKRICSSFFSWYIGVNCLLLLCGGLLALYAYSYLLFSATMLPAVIIVGTIVSEGVRIFLRMILHSRFINRPTVIIDLIATFGYFACVWIPYLSFNRELSMLQLFGPYLASSLFAVLSFFILFFRHYQTLPDEKNSQRVSSNLVRRLVKSRLLNYFAHLSKHFFTGNFLTPLFAVKFGLGYAGLLKFSSYIADSIKALLHVSIGFSGAAMLARLKQRTLTLKRKAFTAMWKTFNIIMYPIIIFISFNFNSLFTWWASASGLQTLPNPIQLSQSAFIISLVLLFISLTENFFMAYEKFYVVEEEVATLLSIKIFEYTLFFSMLTYGVQGPTFILLTAVGVRVLGFFMLAAHAYIKWKIKPYFGAPAWYLASGVIVSIAFSYVFG